MRFKNLVNLEKSHYMEIVCKRMKSTQKKTDPRNGGGGVEGTEHDDTVSLNLNPSMPEMELILGLFSYTN